MDAASDRSVVEEYRRRRFRQRLLIVPVALVAIFAVRARAHMGPPPSFSTIAFASAVAFGSLIYTLINWRCPACGKYLSKRVDPSSCPGCGVKFTD